MSPPLYSPIEPGKPRLRVGVLLNGWKTYAWIADVLHTVRQSEIAEITAVIILPGPNAAPPRQGHRLRPILGLPRSLKRMLWELYFRIDIKWHRTFQAPFDYVDIEPVVTGAAVIDATASLPRFEGVRLFEICASIRDERLDVILHFGTNVLKGEILDTAKHGVWSYRYGDSDGVFDWSGFPEMYSRNPLSCVCLQVLKDAPNTHQVIYRSYGSTGSYESLLMNRYWMHRKAVSFVMRCLRQLQLTGQLSAESPKQSGDRRFDRAPDNLRMLVVLARVFRKMVVARLEDRLGIVRDHWFVAYRWGADPPLPARIHAGMNPIAGPQRKCWADPMVVKSDGTNYLFLEEKDYRTERGRIVVTKIDASGVRGAAQVVIEADYHLSYPFIFQWNGDHYMIPETASARAVKLFRASRFPTNWEFVKDLLTDVHAADATVCQHSGRWYLFVSVSESGGPQSDELFLFHAETPLGPWLPHPMNPVVSDVRRARPAGPLFRDGSRLFRPAQNGAVTYGHAISIVEIASLTPIHYAERLAYEIEPDWLPGIHGTHTISSSEDLTVLDCKRVKWRP